MLVPLGSKALFNPAMMSPHRTRGEFLMRFLSFIKATSLSAYAKFISKLNDFYENLGALSHQ